MAKIVRKTFATIFGSGAASTDIEQFGAQEQTGAPNYTTDPDVIQALSAWADGWRSAIISTNRAPYIQDMNAVLYALSWGVSYLHEMGIPEWDSGTPYYTNSYIQYNGVIYKSLVDDNLNNTPPTGASNAYWNLMRLGSSLPTRTILTSGSGTYTTPSGATRLFIRAVGAGGGAGGGTQSTTTNSVGGNGGATSFDSVYANGGSGGTGLSSGSNNSSTGISGYGGCNGTGTASIRIPGNCGGTPGIQLNNYPLWSSQGPYPLGGLGGASHLGLNPNAPQTRGFPVGYGAGGLGGNSEFPGCAGGGGGGGEYFELLIPNPSSSYSYIVGAGGTGGPAGPGPIDLAGQNGGNGVIIIDEYYD